MLRHVVAVSLMIAGPRGRNSLPGERHIISTFQFAPGKRNMLTFDIATPLAWSD